MNQYILTILIGLSLVVILTGTVVALFVARFISRHRVEIANDLLNIRQEFLNDSTLELQALRLKVVELEKRAFPWLTPNGGFVGPASEIVEGAAQSGICSTTTPTAPDATSVPPAAS